MMCGEIEYRMSKACAKDILGDKKNWEKKGSAQKALCDYVNEQYGLKYKCIKVTVV